MLHIEKILEGKVAPALRKRAATLTLSYEDRCRGELAAMLTGPHASAGWKTVYGAWMFSVVLSWEPWPSWL
jgi:hypothetical protein